MSDQKAPYICGPLTDLPLETRDGVKAFYVRLGDLCEEVLGIRAFVPHEHYDPVKMAHIDKTIVCDAERKIVTQETSLLIVWTIAPSWGGGKELGWAECHQVPMVLLRPKSLGSLSRLVTGGNTVLAELICDDEDHAILQLKAWLLEFDEAQKKQTAVDRRVHEWERRCEDPRELARWEEKISRSDMPPSGAIPSR